MEAEKRRRRVYADFREHRRSNQKRGTKAQQASVEITQVVYRVWLSRGHEKGVLDRFTETPKNL